MSESRSVNIASEEVQSKETPSYLDFDSTHKEQRIITDYQAVMLPILTHLSEFGVISTEYHVARRWLCFIGLSCRW